MVYMTGLCHRSRSLLGGDLWVEAITYLKTQKEQGAECVWGSERDLTGDAEGDWAGQAIMGSLGDPTLTLGSHWGLKYRGWFWLLEDKSRGEPVGSFFWPWRNTGTVSSLWVSSVEVMRPAPIGTTSEGRVGGTSGWIECSWRGKEKLESMLLVCVAGFTAIPSICAIVSRTTPLPSRCSSCRCADQVYI